MGLRLTPSATTMDEREYWGGLKVKPEGTSLKAFNLVHLEHYLRSIAEVEYDWAQSDSPVYAPEAVKAQAVAARSYAIKTFTDDISPEPYLNDNQWDQVYRGYSFELQYPGIAQAAQDTSGRVLRYAGKVVDAFFSASSGGYTTTWGTSSPPYLVAKPDPYSLKAPTSAPGPGYPWSFTVSADDLSAAVAGMRDTAGHSIVVGKLYKLEVVTRDSADAGSHALTIRLTGDKGTAVVLASALRARFGYATMRSTLITGVKNPGFADVPPQHAYYDEIMQVGRLGLVSGYGDGTYRPEEGVSRWQFAKMAVGLHNQLFPADRIEVVDVETAPFADVPCARGTWATSRIGWPRPKPRAWCEA